MPLEVKKYNSLKELLSDMENSVNISKENLQRVLNIIEEEWTGEGEGSASYPGITILVDPNKEW